MSEHRYYEFQAIDRPLTDREMGELRSYSTRARITPTSFVNDYSCGLGAGASRGSSVGGQDSDEGADRGLVAKCHRADVSQHSREARSIANAAPKKVLR